MPKNQGDPCSQGAECMSGFCFDGVCCNGDCSSSCKQCNAVGTVGTCTLTTQPQPDAQRVACVVQGECGGTCDGASPDCVYPGSNQEIVPCGTTPDSCKNDMVRVTHRCDGFGDCGSFELNCQETGDPLDPCALKCSGAGVCAAIDAGSVCKAPDCNGDNLSTYACDANHTCSPNVTTCAVACTTIGDQLGCLSCNYDDDCADASLICVDHQCVAAPPLICASLHDVVKVDGTPVTTCAENQICASGVCVPAVACADNSACKAGERCTYGICAPVSQKLVVNDLPPLGFDEACGCRAPGASSIGSTHAGAILSVVVVWIVAARTRSSRARKLSLRTLLLPFFALLISGCPLPPQEELPADEACKDTAYALSNLVLTCTNDYDQAVEMGDSFEGKFRCNATDVNQTPRYYRCPAEVRALTCDQVAGFGLDAEKYLAATTACGVLFSHLDGSPIVGASGAGGSSGAAGTSGGAGSAGTGGSSAGSGGSAGVGATAGTAGTAGAP